MLNSWNIRFWEYEFLAPHWLWLLVIVPFVWLYLFWREKHKKGHVKYSRSIEDQQSIGSKWILRSRELLIILQGLILALCIFAIAKPFHFAEYDDFDKNYKEGIDIILAMDVSLSMLARDFEPNRLEAAKKVAKEFVDGRHGDRIGLVVYAGEAYTACPATLDYAALKHQIDVINSDRIEGGTAIGTGLGTAVTRLRNDSIASKVIILLTDGSNNSGDISPETAAELARAKNIRVYTIGMGSTGDVSMPVVSPFGIQYTNMPVEIDEATLTRIAEITNGQYFRATDEASLKSIYDEIEKLEKRKMEDEQFKSEPPANPKAFLNWAFILVLITWGTKIILFRFDV